MICNLCESKDVKFYKTVDLLDLYKCNKCGIVFVSPFPKISYESDYYENYGEEPYINKERSKALSSENFLIKLEEFVPRKGNLIEVGSATGYLLDNARARGWNVLGVDISQWARNYAKDKLQIESYEDINTIQEKADAVIMLNTIEHFKDPKKMLFDIRNKLKHRGHVLITTPNFDDLRFIFKRHKNPNVEAQHNYYFTVRTLKSLLGRMGFDVVYQRSPLISRMVDSSIVKNVETKRKIMKLPLFKIFKKLDNSNYGTTVEIIARKR